MNDGTFANMRDIGALFGKTSHQVGRLLKEKKLRVSDGTPSADALKNGVAARFEYDGHTIYLWNRKRLINIFEGFHGWKRIADPPEGCAEQTA